MGIRRLHGFIHFGDWTVPDPESERLHNLSWRLRYATETITDSDKLMAAELISAYCALLAEDHLSVTRMLEKLKQIVKAVREVPAAEQPESKEGRRG